MTSLYSILIALAGFFLKIATLFSPKISLFVAGRRTTFNTLRSHLTPYDKTIWFHAASLGEYEQGLPVMEQIKAQFPTHKLVLTFFSPSGYEVRKNNTIADVTVYLPWDTRHNAKEFLAIVHPELVFFIKYEFWPNFLKEIKKQSIKTYLISGIFRENQAFFKWYGGFYRKALLAFDYFFVQNDTSKKLLQGLGFTNVSVSGDTRFDRVISILKQNNTLDSIEAFKNNTLTLVVGSSWPKDEAMLLDYINHSDQNIKYIIAPHSIKSEPIQALQKSLHKKSVLFSEVQANRHEPLADYTVFILDTVGLLTKVYSYADIAYVGGGFGNPGVHNILEPATFGIPIVIGPHYTHFAEATALVQLEGCLSISSQSELNQAFDTLINNETIRREKGQCCSAFVQMNQGATATITSYILNETLK